jgi:hypothetical protein
VKGLSDRACSDRADVAHRITWNNNVFTAAVKEISTAQRVRIDFNSAKIVVLK